MVSAVQQILGVGGKDVENDLVMIFFLPQKEEDYGNPWRIIGAAVGFGKRPRIGVVLSRLL